MKNWETTYKEKGEVQTGVADIIKNSLEILKKRNVKKVLDLGFGTGRHIIFLADNGFDVYGIDISKTGKKITEKKIKEKNLNNALLKKADMHDIPFGDNFFDAVFAIYVIEHNTFAGLKKTVSEMLRVLKPKGIIVATTISTKDPRYKMGKKVEQKTFINLYNTTGGDDSDVPHRFSDKKEMKRLFYKFNILDMKEVFGYSERRKAKIVHWEIIAEKRIHEGHR